MLGLGMAVVERNGELGKGWLDSVRQLWSGRDWLSLDRNGIVSSGEAAVARRVAFLRGLLRRSRIGSEWKGQVSCRRERLGVVGQLGQGTSRLGEAVFGSAVVVRQSPVRNGLDRLIRTWFGGCGCGYGHGA